MRNLFIKFLLLLIALQPICKLKASEVAHFDMTLRNGTVTDSVSGVSYDVVGGSLHPLNVAGARGEALRFDGYSNYIVAKLPDTTLSTFTLSVWCAIEAYPMMNTVEAENVATFATLAGNLDDETKTGLAVMLSSQGDMKVRFYTCGWGPYELLCSDKLPRTQWNHLVITLASDRTLSLYNNGSLMGSCRTMGSVTFGKSDFYVGKSAESLMQGQYNLNTFCGLIDDITLYDYVQPSVVTDNVPEVEPQFCYPASRYEANEYAALWRPVFHAMPSGSWTNESHGMAYSNGRYHIFFQKNPNGPYMARLHWGHISSENLYDWREENIAFGPSEVYDLKGCWSGCVFADDVLTGGTPMAFYTGVDNGKATICSASPLDADLINWAKSGQLISGKPSTVTDDFRDCYVFGANGSHYMIVGSSQNDVGVCTLHNYDAGSWTNDGTLFFKGANKSSAGRFWEMPNVTPMAGDSYLFTVTPLETAQGVETLYWVGSINADGTFNSTTPVATPGKVELDGFSKDGFGMLSPTVFQKDGKTIALGIVPDKLATEYNYQIGWAHNYSLPREWTVQNGELLQKPYSGLAGMRSLTSCSIANQRISTTQELGDVNGRVVEVEAEFEVGTSVFGLTFLSSGPNGAKLSYNPVNNMLTLDLTSVPRISNDAGTFDGVYSSLLPVKPAVGEVLKLHVFFDHSIFDIFVNERWAASVRVFPTDSSADGVTVFADGETLVKTLNAWNLDPKSSSGLSQVSVDSRQGANPDDNNSYNLAGQLVGDDYCGMVINKGKKYINK